MASVRVRRGSEGPSYDPYGFTEVIFTRTDGVVVRMHCGLGTWVEFGAWRTREGEVFDEKALHWQFEQWTGMSFRRAASIPEVLERRMLRRMSRRERMEYEACQRIDAQMLRWM